MNAVEETQQHDEFVIESARADDQSTLVRLLSSAVPDCSPQTVWDVPWLWPRYRVARDRSGSVIAAGTLQELEGNRVEIRGLAVDEDWRGKGVAGALVEDLLDIADEQGKEAVCVTRKPSFFERFGFHMTFPSWLSRQRQQVHGGRKDAAPRVAMINCRPVTA